MAGMLTPENIAFMDAMRDIAKDKAFVAGQDIKEIHHPFFNDKDFQNTFGKLSTTDNEKNIQNNREPSETSARLMM